MTLHFLGVAARAAVCLAGCGAAAHGATVTLQPAHDNTIFSESQNSNGTGRLYAGETSNGDVRRALFKFDLALSGIPAGALIDSVSLSLTQTKIGPGSSGVFELHPLLAAFGERSSFGLGAGGTAALGDATWGFRQYNFDPWSVAGGDFGSTSGTTTLGTSLTIYTFATAPGLVSDVQSWLNTPAANFGWLLKAANESSVNARELGSRESSLAEQPTLTINYTPAPEPGSLALLAGGAALLALRRGGRKG
jgi:hypothetical protein